MTKPAESSDSKHNYNYLVPAVEQAALIMAALARHNPGRMTLTEICRAVGIHISKGFSILNTLQRFALVQKDPASKTYSLGMGLIFLSQKVLDNLDLRRIAEPFLHRLASGTGSTAFLGLIADDHFYVAAKDQGGQVVAVTFRLGHRFPVFWGAHGKAILASLPEEERRAMLASGKLRFRDCTSGCDSDNLEQELASCRENGYAVDPGESKIGIRAVAACVFGPTAKLIGALVVIGTFSEDLVEEYGRLVAKEAREFSSSLRGSQNAV